MSKETKYDKLLGAAWVTKSRQYYWTESEAVIEALAALDGEQLNDTAKLDVLLGDVVKGGWNE